VANLCTESSEVILLLKSREREEICHIHLDAKISKSNHLPLTSCVTGII
jgi:hypothetical protein